MSSNDRPEAEWPRILFVTSAAFNNITGGGITFTNLFRGWPADRLATVHSDPVPVTTDVCRQYYKLQPHELGRWPHWLDRARPPLTPGVTPAAAGRGSSTTFRTIKTLLAGNTWLDRGHLSPALDSWISQFRPTVLYSILGTIGTLELVDRIRRRHRLKLAVHFMDDWASTLYRGGLLAPALRWRMQSLIQRLVDSAAARLGICDEMCSAYEQRYGSPFLSIQNPVNRVAARAAWTNRKAGDPARLLYVGSIFDNAQLYSLIDVAHAVARLNAAGRRIRFEIYSPMHLAAPFRPLLEVDPAVVVHDTVTDDGRFFDLIAAADALLLPVNFDSESVRFIRYSMPTKIPAYLASGAPILVYGSPETAQVTYAARSGWGRVVGTRSRDELEAGLCQTLFDDDLRNRLVATARETAVRNHDTDTVRSRFQNALIHAAEA